MAKLVRWAGREWLSSKSANRRSEPHRPELVVLAVLGGTLPDSAREDEPKIGLTILEKTRLMCGNR